MCFTDPRHSQGTGSREQPPRANPDLKMRVGKALQVEKTTTAPLLRPAAASRTGSSLREVCLISHSSNKSSLSFPDVTIPLGILCPVASPLFWAGRRDGTNSSIDMLKGEPFPARTLAQQPQRLVSSRSLPRQRPVLQLQHTAGTWHVSAWHPAAPALRSRRTAKPTYPRLGSSCRGMSCPLPSWSSFEGFANQIPVWSRNQPCRGWYFQLNLSVHRAQTLLCFLK